MTEEKSRQLTKEQITTLGFKMYKKAHPDQIEEIDHYMKKAEEYIENADSVANDFNSKEWNENFRLLITALVTMAFCVFIMVMYLGSKGFI